MTSSVFGVAEADVVVIGGGIAGIAVASELSASATVVVIEAESELARHSTGRSAATFVSSSGTPVVRQLALASRERFVATGADAEPPIGQPLPLVRVASAPHAKGLITGYEQARSCPGVSLLTADEAAERAPVVRRDRIVGAILDSTALDLDVHALHQGYFRQLRQRGGEVHTGVRVQRARRRNGYWHLDAGPAGIVRAPVVVNAAGAWADEVARQFGAAPQGLKSYRRSVFILSVPEVASAPRRVLVGDIAMTFYCKPEGRDHVLASPIDATPTEPGVPSPDELAIAKAIDAVHHHTYVTSRRVTASWAGLRTFHPSGDPVVGFDPVVRGFYWCAGLGGFGIQVAPAVAELASTQLTPGADSPGRLSQVLDPTLLLPR